MTKPSNATERGLAPHWKVRVVLPGAILHLCSRTEPRMRISAGRFAHVAMDLVTDTEHGDTMGFIDWSAVVAVTWRFAPEVRNREGD